MAKERQVDSKDARAVRAREDVRAVDEPRGGATGSRHYLEPGTERGVVLHGSTAATNTARGATPKHTSKL